MHDSNNVIDLAARRAQKQKAAEKPRLSPEMLKEKQRPVIEELRALGYEMTNVTKAHGTSG
jgi:hypothetical protein